MTRDGGRRKAILLGVAAVLLAVGGYRVYRFAAAEFHVQAARAAVEQATRAAVERGDPAARPHLDAARP
ncbi:MAG: hypothetical protein K2X87_30670, partial [Gemmataceae bacterium]|nr:hypothetical protein [Gemmataceae bacterium]